MTRLTHSQMDAALQELYDQIPAIPDCTGQCWISCSAIDMSDRERQRIRQAGFEITPVRQAIAQVDTYWCEALTAGKRCAVYQLRPLICRLWGTAERFRCPYGCRPEGGWLSDETVFLLIAEAARIGGGDPAFTRAELERAFGSEMFARIQRMTLEVGQAVDLGRAADAVPPAFRWQPKT